MCCELIDSRAKKCIHCSAVQSKWATLDGNPWALAVTAIFLIVVLGNLFLSVLWQPHFRDHVQQLTTETTRIDFADSSAGRSISCLGSIASKSKYDWTDIKFSAHLYNTKGELIDTFSGSDNTLLIPANGQATYRVHGVAALPQSEYQKCEVQITQASLARH
jgi:hypothetical protein